MTANRSTNRIEMLMIEMLSWMRVFRVEYTSGIDLKNSQRTIHKRDVLAFNFSHAENVVLSITDTLAKEGKDDETNANINTIAVLANDLDFHFVGQNRGGEFDEFSDWNQDLTIYKLAKEFCEAFEADRGGLDRVTEELSERNRMIEEVMRTV